MFFRNYVPLLAAVTCSAMLYCDTAAAQLFRCHIARSVCTIPQRCRAQPTCYQQPSCATLHTNCCNASTPERPEPTKDSDLKETVDDKGVSTEHTAKIAAALQEMRTTAKRSVEVNLQNYRNGAVDYREVAAASRELLEVELKIAKTPADRIKVLTQTLALAKESEQSTEARFKGGELSEATVLQARLDRMKIEVMILEETK